MRNLCLTAARLWLANQERRGSFRLQLSASALLAEHAPIAARPVGTLRQARSTRFSLRQAAVLDAVGGPRGWWHNGVVKLEGTLLRKPFENARNPCAFAQKGAAWSIRDGVESPLVLAITHEIAVANYRPSCAFITLDDAIKL
jgi:hypothetical protein